MGKWESLADGFADGTMPNSKLGSGKDVAHVLTFERLVCPDFCDSGVPCFGRSGRSGYGNADLHSRQRAVSPFPKRMVDREPRVVLESIPVVAIWEGNSSPSADAYIK